MLSKQCRETAVLLEQSDWSSDWKLAERDAFFFFIS